MQASSPGRRPIRARQVKLLFLPMLLTGGMFLILLLSVIEQVKGNGGAGQLFFGLFGLTLFLIGAYFFVLLAVGRRRLDSVQRNAPLIQSGFLVALCPMCAGLGFASQHLLILSLGDSWIPTVVGGFFVLGSLFFSIVSIKRLYSSYAQ